MNPYIAIANLDAVLNNETIVPSITLWNRLEGRPRTDDFDRALRAEIRDPLWMLTKQWQMGEFEGDDAGSPISGKVQIATTQLTKYRAANLGVEAFDDDVPLEAKVEQRAIPFRSGDRDMSLDIRLLMGRRWLKLISELDPDLKSQFISQYGIAEPDPELAADATICAHKQAWQQISAVAGRAMDGWKLYGYLIADTNHHAYDSISINNDDLQQQIEALEREFIAWYEELFYQPLDENHHAWLPERLEYAFSCSAPQDSQEKSFVADEYYHGHLDWYNLDIDPTEAGLGPVQEGPEPPTDVEETITSSFIPTPLKFNGMPNTRWWTFEEGQTNFGDIDPDTTDLNKLLLIEFALVYANDWFLLPFTVPAGTIANVKGMSITNVFGERIWIEASGRGDDEDWQRWSMYSLSTKGDDDVPADLSLLVLPSVPKIQQSQPLETVRFARDEVANMVWGVETTIPLASGESKSGRSAALELRRLYSRLVDDNLPDEFPPVEELENEASIRYQLMTSVPEHWIPFIPVHVEGSVREVQLRRAAMPRILDNDPNPPRKIRPRTSLLRYGLDMEVPQVYDVHEEEVPRAGAEVSQTFQRTRWYSGEVFTWFGAHKKTSRGESYSRLSFDSAVRKR